jgi:hypothetical protein
MAMVTWEFDESIYCMLSTHDGFGDERVTYHELSEARTVPAPAGDASPGTAVPGPTAVTVKIYPPAEGKPPSVYFDGHQAIPFTVLKHFTDLVTADIEAPTT